MENKPHITFRPDLDVWEFLKKIPSGKQSGKRSAVINAALRQAFGLKPPEPTEHVGYAELRKLTAKAKK